VGTEPWTGHGPVRQLDPVFRTPPGERLAVKFRAIVDKSFPRHAEHVPARVVHRGRCQSNLCSMQSATASAEGASSPKWQPRTLRVAKSTDSDSQGRPMDRLYSESTIITSARV
jgi:hypothetical protein